MFHALTLDVYKYQPWVDNALTTREQRVDHAWLMRESAILELDR